MSRSDTTILLAQIHESASRAISYIEGMSKADFLLDTRTQEAVAMNLINIGEATAVLLRRHPEVASLYPDVSWGNIQGMRNRIAHGYFSLDMNVVWETAREALPRLLAAIGSAVEKFVQDFEARTSTSSNDKG